MSLLRLPGMQACSFCVNVNDEPVDEQELRLKRGKSMATHDIIPVPAPAFACIMNCIGTRASEPSMLLPWQAWKLGSHPRIDINRQTLFYLFVLHAAYVDMNKYRQKYTDAQLSTGCLSQIMGARDSADQTIALWHDPCFCTYTMGRVQTNKPSPFKHTRRPHSTSTSTPLLAKRYCTSSA